MTNRGLSVTAVAGVTSGCRDRQDLDRQNVYSRTRCNSGWCAHMYAYYFEKDQTSQIGGGHRHDWEHVVVWTRNDRIEYVSVSAHKGYDIRAARDVQMEGNHPKVVYHKDDSNGMTHALRFANAGEAPENHYGRWWVSCTTATPGWLGPDANRVSTLQYGTLISYYGFPNHDFRNAMLNKGWERASVDIRDARFMPALESARPGAASAFKAGQDGPEDIHNSPGIPEGGCGVRS